MHVFLTGASGYLGSRIATRLLARGHEVTGLVRREGSAPDGVRERPGDLARPQDWTQAVREADATIHTAFGHAEDFADAVATERGALDAMLDALRPEGTLIATSAAGVLGDTGPVPAPDDAPISADFPPRIRGFVEDRVRAAAPDGPRLSAMRLPVLVYGAGGGPFVPGLIEAARRDGVSRIVGNGTNRLSSVHVDDAADAYLAALDRGRTGTVYNVAAETVTGRELAEAVALNAGISRVEAVDLDAAQAALHPFMALLISMTFDLDATLARQELAWSPQAPSLIEDLTEGSYARQAA